MLSATSVGFLDSHPIGFVQRATTANDIGSIATLRLEDNDYRLCTDRRPLTIRLHVLAVCALVGLLFMACTSPSDSAVNGSTAASPSASPPGTPTRLFLLSSGGSMSTAFDNTTYWNAATNAVQNAVQLWQAQDQLGTYVYQSGGTPCPQMAEVPPRLNNANAIMSAIASVVPSNNSTPAEGITAATDYLGAAGVDLRTARIILLFNSTVGSCVGSGDTSYVISAAQSAFAQGVALSVVNMAPGNSTFLQQLANAGAGLPISGSTNAHYDEATTAQEVIDAVAALGP